MTLEKIPRVLEVIPTTQPKWAPLIYECPYCHNPVAININLDQLGRGSECPVCGGVSFIKVEWVDPPKEATTEQVKAI